MHRQTECQHVCTCSVSDTHVMHGRQAVPFSHTRRAGRLQKEGCVLFATSPVCEPMSVATGPALFSATVALYVAWCTLSLLYSLLSLLPLSLNQSQIGLFWLSPYPAARYALEQRAMMAPSGRRRTLLSPFGTHCDCHPHAFCFAPHSVLLMASLDLAPRSSNCCLLSCIKQHKRVIVLSTNTKALYACLMACAKCTSFDTHSIESIAIPASVEFRSSSCTSF